jgi:hypothetical protein
MRGEDPIDAEAISVWMGSAVPSAWRTNIPVHAKAPKHFRESL